jgi:hypothetical protein
VTNTFTLICGWHILDRISRYTPYRHNVVCVHAIMIWWRKRNKRTRWK